MKIRVFISSLILMAAASLSACQTTAVKEEKLILAQGLFRSDSIESLKERKESTGRIQWVSASQGGRYAGVLFNIPGFRYVISRGNALNKRELKGWNFFKDADIQFGVEGKIRTPLGNIPFARFKFEQQQCVYFRLPFGYANRDDGGRYGRSISGYFCEPAYAELKDITISDFLHQVGVTGYFDPRPVTAPSGGSSPTQEVKREIQHSDDHICRMALHSSDVRWDEGVGVDAYIADAKSRGLTPFKCAALTRTKASSLASSSTAYPAIERTVTGTWEGEPEPIKGKLVSDKRAGQGRLQINLKSIEETCIGQWMWGKGEYNTSILPQGTWSIACDNGKTASGTYLSSKFGIGTIEGVDNDGNKIRMEFN